MKWPYYNLTQLTQRFISGGTPSTKIPSFWIGNIPWITGADVLNNKVMIGRRFISETAIATSATNIVPENSILIVTRTGVGKIALAPLNLAISQDITGIILKDDIDSKYALLAIRSQMHLLLNYQRGATIKGVTRKDVENIKIPLPPIAEQRRIVEILDQADVLKKKCTEADAKAARILPALFYKMFGDPATNSKRWQIQRLGNPQVAAINPKFSDENISADAAFSFVPMSDIDEIWGRVVGRQVRKYNDVMRGFTSFQDNDVLFAKITPCMQNGKAAIARNLVNGRGFGSTEFHVLRAGQFATPEWLYVLVRLSWFRRQAEASFTGTVGQQRVPADFLARCAIGCPPIELQKRFAMAVKQFQECTEQTDKSRKKLRTLFSVLLHRAFTGNLTAKWREAHMKELLQEMKQQVKSLNLRGVL